MHIGLLDQQVQLRQYSESNNHGELTKGFTNSDLVFAQVITQKGQEAFQAARMNARAIIRVGMHYRTDVQTTWQLIWEGNTFNVTEVDRSSRRDGLLWLTAEAVGAV